MKYAFVIGSSAFVVHGKTISYGEEGNWKHFLKINAVSEGGPGPNQSHLDIDLDINDIDGTRIALVSNKSVTAAATNIETERDSVKVLRPDGSTIIHVHQLDNDSAMSLEHNIVAELEVNMPVAVIRVTGEFFVDQLHIRAENEKLLINDNGYATTALAGDNDLKFTTQGVVL
ncbi:MAG TPA: hypothetical protein VHA56_12760 [Mucilaginibacter sp.]|nr:hypothetical protein [Mucilaginibacter sp.]